MDFKNALRENKEKPKLAPVEVPTMESYLKKTGSSLEGQKPPEGNEDKDRIKLRYFLDAYKKNPSPERKKQLKEMRESFKKRHGK